MRCCNNKGAHPSLTLLLAMTQTPLQLVQCLQCRHRCRLRQRALALLMIHSILSATKILLPHLYPVPYHTSALLGAAWVQELLSGHEDCIKCKLSVRKHVFHSLVEVLHCEAGLSNSKHVCLEEQVAIFLYTCTTGLAIQHVVEHFQRTWDHFSVSFLFQYL
jgi:hypothetical protein